MKGPRRIIHLSYPTLSLHLSNVIFTLVMNKDIAIKDMSALFIKDEELFNAFKVNFVLTFTNDSLSRGANEDKI